MNLSTLTPMQLSAGQIALSVVLAVVGFAFLLPRPSGRRVGAGIAALIASAIVFGAWTYTHFGRPMSDTVGTVLFCLFSTGALGFGAILVVQKNPGRGAIAFAFVILSTCGLFLLLAAPFLMAATVIIYAGAIIVTFLFVLMLSHAGGPSNENDRSREPLFGALAGFAFTGLVLFSLYITAHSRNLGGEDELHAVPHIPQRLPAPVLTNAERNTLADVLKDLDGIDGVLKGETTPPAERDSVIAYFDAIKNRLGAVVGSDALSRDGSIRVRLEKLPMKPGEKVVPLRVDPQSQAVLRQAAKVREQNDRANDTVFNNVYDGKPDRAEARKELNKLREETLLLMGNGELPARNVGNLGYLLYTSHLLAIELAGTLLLIATIGAVAIAHRKGAAT
jgi:NADH:ubiquinone oxidoreductase subunit 6 (subunit J)